jgi:hypothetical protein
MLNNLIIIQRGNAASIRGTFPDSALLSEIFVGIVNQKCYNGCFFKFGVEVGLELSIVNALYRLRITDRLFKF